MWTPPQIARELGVSDNTVRRYIRKYLKTLQQEGILRIKKSGLKDKVSYEILVSPEEFGKIIKKLESSYANERDRRSS
jgi:transcriptional antiterminator